MSDDAEYYNRECGRLSEEITKIGKLIDVLIEFTRHSEGCLASYGKQYPCKCGVIETLDQLAANVPEVTQRADVHADWLGRGSGEKPKTREELVAQFPFLDAVLPKDQRGGV